MYSLVGHSTGTTDLLSFKVHFAPHQLILASSGTIWSTFSKPCSLCFDFCSRWFLCLDTPGICAPLQTHHPCTHRHSPGTCDIPVLVQDPSELLPWLLLPSHWSHWWPPPGSAVVICLSLNSHGPLGHYQISSSCRQEKEKGSHSITHSLMPFLLLSVYLPSKIFIKDKCQVFSFSLNHLYQAHSSLLFWFWMKSGDSYLEMCLRASSVVNEDYSTLSSITSKGRAPLDHLTEGIWWHWAKHPSMCSLNII